MLTVSAAIAKEVPKAFARPFHWYHHLLLFLLLLFLFNYFTAFYYLNQNLRKSDIVEYFCLRSRRTAETPSTVQSIYELYPLFPASPAHSSHFIQALGPLTITLILGKSLGRAVCVSTEVYILY